VPETENDAFRVAERIQDARAMRVSGGDYFGVQLSLDIADEIERFVAGEEPPSVPSSVLTTVMFTDLVGSTERATRSATRPGGSFWPHTTLSSGASYRDSNGRIYATCVALVSVQEGSLTNLTTRRFDRLDAA